MFLDLIGHGCVSWHLPHLNTAAFIELMVPQRIQYCKEWPYYLFYIIMSLILSKNVTFMNIEHV